MRKSPNEHHADHKALTSPIRVQSGGYMTRVGCTLLLYMFKQSTALT